MLSIHHGGEREDPAADECEVDASEVDINGPSSISMEGEKKYGIATQTIRPQDSPVATHLILPAREKVEPRWIRRHRGPGIISHCYGEHTFLSIRAYASGLAR